jgi:hypothetical protein
MKDKLSSRKFLMCITVQLLLFVFLWYGKIPANVVENLTGLIVTVYICGNVYQKKLIGEDKNDS